ncbi:MAG: acyltransferase [Pseudomonadota bacterium]|nr:acyltransferase [Pseudomonadota bacterium]
MPASMHALLRYFAAPLRPRPRAGGRLSELDGVRGWAALGVVCFHVFWETMYVRAPEMRNIVTGVLFDGGLAVSIFFVLSGEALSAPFFQGKGDAAVRALAIKRYTRLALPVLASCALLWALGAARLIYVDQAAAIAGNSHWLTGWLAFPLTLAGLVKYALFEVFTLVRPAQEWNPFLWTMGVELDGSLLVFAILLFARDWKGARGLLLLAAVALAFSPMRAAQNVSCFLVGLLFADFRAAGGFAALAQSGRGALFATALAGVMLDAGAAAYSGHHDHKNLYAIAMLFLVFATPAASAFFRAPLSQFLGKISFPLYLVQFPVIVAPMSAAMVLAEGHGAFGRPMAYAIGVAAVGLAVGLAYAFLPVERLTATVGAALVAWARPGQARLSASAVKSAMRG